MLSYRSITIFFFSCFMGLSSMAQEKMRIYAKDGSVIEYDMAKLDSVVMESPSRSGYDEVPTVGGTISESVDMALPSGTKWAAHNVGATCKEDFGVALNYTDAHTGWDQTWSVPTAADWQELYDNCKWEWIVMNGVEGRLVIAKNGNTLFFPAAGLSIDNDKLLGGCSGLYWSDDKNESGSQSVGLYFDSGNIYQLEYPTSNKLYVRMVFRY